MNQKKLGLIFSLLLTFSCFEGRTIKTAGKNAVESRPGFHFTAPVNWMNDPNGPVYYKGVYHLFYQNYPTAISPQGPIVWGHAISDNLLDWAHLDVAMKADQPYDAQGVWTGSILIDEKGELWLFYTGVTNKGEQVTCSARPANPNDPLLRKWVKNVNNPIFRQPFANLTGGFRDPNTPWRNPSTKEWNMVVGSGNGNLGAIATLFSSPDLNNWRFSGFFKKCDKQVFCNGFYECNDWYALKAAGTQKEFHIFKYSDGDDYYSVGNYDPSKSSYPFKGLPNRESMYDWGKGTFYASKSFVDAKGRRLVWAWLRESGTAEGTKSRGWQGVQGLRLATLTQENILAFNPIPETESLRYDHFSSPNIKVDSGKSVPLGPFGSKVDINFLVPNATQSSFSFNFRSDKSGREFTSLRFVNQGMLEGTDLPGSDYNDFPNLIDAFACRRVCNDDVGCAAFTFVAKTSTSISHCFLKRPDSVNPTSKSGVTSGFKAHVFLDASKSSLAEPTRSLMMPIYNSINLDVRIVLDNSVVEIFLNGGRYSMTSRIYPTLPDAINIEFKGEKGSTLISKFDLWKMKDSFINFSDIPLPSNN
eukprot:TRINITY_DN7173_c0_g1_i3.p1 TRINITY_DN7173_c0_g1~~TRINITY_DN7173_c0_g1_i3.p1  ORF type:complete len:588 (-),score=156.19 TRINITY_DN7173_c0_g1_i3:3-1766(-)